MNGNNRRVLAWPAGFTCAVMGFSVLPASAAIIDIDATVSTTVQELINGVPGSVTSDEDGLNADSSNLPLTASGDLMSTDLQGVLVSMGQAFSAFSDPTRLDQPNPEEFALEVGCYSNADSVAYLVTSTATEWRTVVFTTEGSSLAPPEIDFGLTRTRTVESRIFLSGAVIFWSTEPERNFDDMTSDFSVTVVRDDTNATLFDTTLRISGEGTDQPGVTTTGPIRSEIVELDDLLPEGVDADTIAILEGVEREGTLLVVVIPPQEHPYAYTVRANDPLMLRAEMNIRVRNAPGGSGVAATLGSPFENLADFIEPGLPGVNGKALESSLNAVTASRAIGFVASTGSSAHRSGPGLCGVFGVESAVAVVLCLLMMLGRSRW